MWDIFKLKKLGIFAGGVLFGTAGVKLLSSKDAKKVYTSCTAAALRAKDCIMKTATTGKCRGHSCRGTADERREGGEGSRLCRRRCQGADSYRRIECKDYSPAAACGGITLEVTV